MEFKQLVTRRRSVHNFEAQFKVSSGQWNEILEYVRYTPSGYNAQPWSFKLIQEPAALKILHSICLKQDHILKAGNLVVVIGDVNFGTNEAERIVKEWETHRNLPPNKVAGLRSSLTKQREVWKKREMTLRNCSLAAMTLMYAAEDLGLATCPMMGFKQLDLKRYLNLAEHELPVMLIALGKSAQKEAPRLPRKNAENIKHKK